MTGEGVPWREALGNQRAVELLDGDPVGREHRALIGSTIWRDGRALLVQPHGHAARVGVLQHALEREKAAAGDDRGLDLVVPLPAIQAAMRIEDLAE